MRVDLITGMLTACLLVCLTVPGPALAEQEWGDLSITFVYDGDPPERKRIEFDRRPPADVKLPEFDRSLLVDAKTKGVANVVMWIRQQPNSGEALPIHPSYDRLAQEPVKLTSRNLQWEPRVVFVRTGQILQIQNPNSIGHNLKADLFNNPSFGELLPPDVPFKKSFSKEETRPSHMCCNIYSWLDGWILIRNDPYVGTSDSQGKLTIKNIPVGKHTFALWHELPGWIKEFKLDGKGENLEYGRLTVDIKPGDNDLGEIVFKPDRR